MDRDSLDKLSIEQLDELIDQAQDVLDCKYADQKEATTVEYKKIYQEYVGKFYKIENFGSLTYFNILKVHNAGVRHDGDFDVLYEIRKLYLNEERLCADFDYINLSCLVRNDPAWEYVEISEEEYHTLG